MERGASHVKQQKIMWSQLYVGELFIDILF